MSQIKNQRQQNISNSGKNGKKNEALSVSQNFLQHIIQQSHYSLQQISEATEISYHTLYRLHRGITREPRDAVFKKILGLYCQLCQQPIAEKI